MDDAEEGFVDLPVFLCMAGHTDAIREELHQTAAGWAWLKGL